MKKMIFLIITIFLILAIIFMGFWLGRGQLGWLGKKMETTQICFNGQCFVAEVAKTKAQRALGLMFRESLDRNKAMLFVFEKKGVYSFWMKNCQIPLDIIWLDEDYKVVAIIPNNQPCGEQGCFSINPGVLAQYVLEINAGLASKIGLFEDSYFTLLNP